MRRAVAAIALAGCMPHVVPPPTVPERVLPTDAKPPGPGQVAIMTVDEANEPAIVEEPTGTVEGVTADGNPVTGVVFSTVCAATPCLASLPPGDHVLRFTSLADPHDGGTATITVGSQPTAFRYEMGHNTDASPYRGIAALTLGTSAITMGLVLVGIGKHTDLPSNSIAMEGPGCEGPFPSTNYTTAGAITAIVGVALSALGVYWLDTRTGTSQDGSGVQWTPGA
jgi:hypothetical protein